MLGLHHLAPRPTAVPGSVELGRVDWLVLGTTALVAGAVAHALSGVVGIAKDMVHSAPQGAPAPDRPAPPTGLTVNERDGWILISALFLITAAMGHAVQRIVESVREVVRPARPRVRS
ncbi:hypothetical protein AB0C76_24155 [Kitasatospora sp. NPDC048722]|uniref:hypothetical protein n=1 Tax=Kitasatospora sp. NPDC048722 TaxID=3155639 RepID=UPI0033E4C41F